MTSANIQMQTVHTPTTCKPMSTVTLDLAQILTLASVFYFFRFTFEKKSLKKNPQALIQNFRHSSLKSLFLAFSAVR